MMKSSSPGGKLIINAAVTGCVLSKHDTPFLPVLADEIVACCVRLVDSGVSIVHLHARKADSSPSFDVDDYVDLVARVRQACPGVIVCVSLSGRHESRVDRRAAALAAKPDMASLTLGSMNFISGPSVNSPDTIVELARRIEAAGAVPELEVFEAGFVHYAGFLVNKGILKTPCYFNLILGSLGAAPLDLLGMGHMVSMLPAGSIWSAGGLGRYQLDANVMAIAAGGHVRVGLEDNIYYDRAQTDRADNARLVDRIVRIARDMGREPATADEARAMIGLPGRVAGIAKR